MCFSIVPWQPSSPPLPCLTSARDGAEKHGGDDCRLLQLLPVYRVVQSEFSCCLVLPRSQPVERTWTLSVLSSRRPGALVLNGYAACLTAWRSFQCACRVSAVTKYRFLAPCFYRSLVVVRAARQIAGGGTCCCQHHHVWLSYTWPS